MADKTITDKTMLVFDTNYEDGLTVEVSVINWTRTEWFKEQGYGLYIVAVKSDVIDHFGTVENFNDALFHTPRGALMANGNGEFSDSGTHLLWMRQFNPVEAIEGLLFPPTETA